MNRIDAVKHWDVQPGFLRLFLDGADNLVPLLRGQRFVIHVENGTDTVFTDGLVEFFRIDSNGLTSAVGNHANFELRHLADFFFQRHLADQFFHGRGRSACRRAGRSHIPVQKYLAVDHARSNIIGAGGRRQDCANSQ